MDNIKVEKSDYGLKAQNILAWGNALRNGVKPPLTPPQGEDNFPLEGGLRGASLAMPYASKRSINTKKRK